MTFCPITLCQVDGETMETVTGFIFLSSKITEDRVYSHEIKRCQRFGRKAMTNLHIKLKSRDITLLIKVHLVKVVVFPIVLYGWELDHKESWSLSNWYFWTVMLEKTLESLLDCEEIKPVNSNGNQSWIFFGRNNTEVGIPILWPHYAKSQLIREVPDTRKD